MRIAHGARGRREHLQGRAERAGRHAAEAVEGSARGSKPLDGIREPAQPLAKRRGLLDVARVARVAGALGSAHLAQHQSENAREDALGCAEQRRRHRRQQVSCRREAAVALAEAAARPRALVAAVAAPTVGLSRDVEGNIVPHVVAALEARLADDARLVADLARLALPDYVALGECRDAHALRRGGRELAKRLLYRAIVALEIDGLREQQPI